MADDLKKALKDAGLDRMNLGDLPREEQIEPACSLECKYCEPGNV